MTLLPVSLGKQKQSKETSPDSHLVRCSPAGICAHFSASPPLCKCLVFTSKTMPSTWHCARSLLPTPGHHPAIQVSLLQHRISSCSISSFPAAYNHVAILPVLDTHTRTHARRHTLLPFTVKLLQEFSRLTVLVVHFHFSDSL